MIFTIYGKDNCPYCEKAKDLVDNKGHTSIYVNLDEEDWLKEIFKSRGFKTVPIVYIDTPEGSRYIGGYEELKSYLESNNE